MNKQHSKNILKNINVTILVLVFLTNLASFFMCNENKTNYILISTFFNICLFFVHWFLLSREIPRNLNEIKRESLYINYPVNIGTYFLCLLLILIGSAICLFFVNNDAMNVAFVFTFFMSVITMIFPSLILIAYTFFIFPAFVLPNISANKKAGKDAFTLFVSLLVIFLGISAFKFVSYSIRTIYIDKQNKYKIIKLPIQYSTQYLTLKNISPYGKKKLSQVKLTVPFVYTNDSFNYSDYTSAEIFCNSMGARIPNYLEMYNIAFNKFNTFGDKYYWTQNRDGKSPLLIHFKNMSYSVEKYTGKEKPLLYCVANEKDNKKALSGNYLTRNYSNRNRNNLKSMETEDLNSRRIRQSQTISNDFVSPDINTEKKHVNFSVREVSSEIMQDLLNRGYVYNTQLKINTRYETNDVVFSPQINRDVSKKNIRLCYFPFTDYGDLSIYSESQIWSQSFCSPAFELIQPSPALKTKNEKDDYCRQLGGRVPNIPELNGILRTLRINNIGTKYWTNHKVTGQHSTQPQSVLVYYKDSRFMRVKALSQNENESAYTYCIRNAQVPSKVIANYKSRFHGIDGKPYAQAQCPSCLYYEVPDTIILSY